MYVFMTFDGEWKLSAQYQNKDEIYQNYQMYDIVFKDYLIFYNCENSGVLLDLDYNPSISEKILLDFSALPGCGNPTVADLLELAKKIIRETKIKEIFSHSQV